MNARIHALQVEIKSIESMLNSMQGTMLQTATEELKNRCFELDMLNRTIARNAKLQAVVEETGVFA